MGVMMHYRFYPLAAGDHIAGPAEHAELDDDSEALTFAREVARRIGAVEVWRGPHRVGRVRLESAEEA
jgi:hypothetical protein